MLNKSMMYMYIIYALTNIKISTSIFSAHIHSNLYKPFNEKAASAIDYFSLKSVGYISGFRSIKLPIFPNISAHVLDFKVCFHQFNSICI